MVNLSEALDKKNGSRTHGRHCASSDSLRRPFLGVYVTRVLHTTRISNIESKICVINKGPVIIKQGGGGKGQLYFGGGSLYFEGNFREGHCFFNCI